MTWALHRAIHKLNGIALRNRLKRAQGILTRAQGILTRAQGILTRARDWAEQTMCDQQRDREMEELAR